MAAQPNAPSHRQFELRIDCETKLVARAVWTPSALTHASSTRHSIGLFIYSAYVWSHSAAPFARMKARVRFHHPIHQFLGRLESSQCSKRSEVLNRCWLARRRAHSPIARGYIDIPRHTLTLE
jgi:hypothetical protein